MELDFSWLSRSSFGRTTQTVVRSTQTLCCATSRRLFCWTVKSSFPHDPGNSGEVDRRGSGWVVDRVEVLWLNIARYQPLRGGSYISLLAVVRLKKAVVNVKNKDDHCLRWALRSALFPAWDHVDRPSKYPTIMTAWTSKGSMLPHQSLRFPRLSYKTTWPSMSLRGKRGWFTTSANSPKTCQGSTCCWLKRLANSTTPGSNTSIACSTTRASAVTASTTASAVFMATQGRIC